MTSEATKLAKARIMQDGKKDVKPEYMTKLAKENWLAAATKAFRDNPAMQACWTTEWEMRDTKTEVEIGV